MHVELILECVKFKMSILIINTSLVTNFPDKRPLRVFFFFWGGGGEGGLMIYGCLKTSNRNYM